MPTMSSVYEEIKHLTELGIICHPLRRGEKYPSIEKWQEQTATNMKNFTKRTDRYGILTGEVTGVTVVDVDDVELWPKIVEALSKLDPSLPEVLAECPSVCTGSKGFHYFFDYTEGPNTAENVGLIESGTTRIDSGVDVRNNGGQLVGPMSVYASGIKKPEKAKFNGNIYEWIKRINTREDLPSMPDVLCEFLTKQLSIQIINDEWTVEYKNLTPLIAEREDNLMDTGDDDDVVVLDEEEDKIDQAKQVYVNAAPIDVDFDPYTNSVSAGKKREITLPIMQQILDALDKRVFRTRTHWRNLCWAMKYYAEQQPRSETKILKMLDVFSSSDCGDYKGLADVKAMFELGAGKPGKKRITTGTIMHYLKEQNPTKYEGIVKLIRPPVCVQQIPKGSAKAIDTLDTTYYWGDFYHEFSDRHFDSKSDMYEALYAQAGRVISYIYMTRFYVCKINDANPYKILDNFTTNSDLEMTYVDRKTVKTVKLSKVINNVIISYDDVDFDPSNTKTKILNLWPGFSTKPAAQITAHDDIAVWNTFIREVIAAGDDDSYKYIINWLRFLVGTPGTVPEVGIFIYSKEQGTGKSTFMDFLMKWLIGKELSCAFSTLADLCERFNDSLACKRLVVLHDMTTELNTFHRSKDKLKSYLTEEDIYIEPKNEKRYRQHNTLAFIASSNHDEALRVDKNDRRFACFHVSSKYQQNSEYFGTLKQRCFNGEFAAQYMAWLLSEPGHHHLIRKIPETEFITEMKANHIDPEELFLRELKERYDTQDDDVDVDVDDVVSQEYLSKTLFKMYCDFCEEQRLPIKLNAVKFGTYLTHHTTTKRKTNKGIVYDISTITLK